MALPSELFDWPVRYLDIYLFYVYACDASCMLAGDEQVRADGERDRQQAVEHRVHVQHGRRRGGGASRLQGAGPRLPSTTTQ